MFENPRRGRQARNFTTNVPKILDLKSSSGQIFFRKLSLGAPVIWTQYSRYPSSFCACKDLQVKNKVTWFLSRQTTDKSCHYKLSTEQQQKVKILQFQKRHWQTMGGGDLCLDNGLYWKPLLFLCSLWNHVKFLLSHQFLGAFTKCWVSRMRSISIWKHWVYKEFVSGNKVY